MCHAMKLFINIFGQDKKQGGELYKHLRRQGRRYRKRGNLKDSRGIIKNRVSIDERPPLWMKKEDLETLKLIQ